MNGKQKWHQYLETHWQRGTCWQRSGYKVLTDFLPYKSQDYYSVFLVLIMWTKWVYSYITELKFKILVMGFWLQFLFTGLGLREDTSMNCVKNNRIQMIDTVKLRNQLT